MATRFLILFFVSSVFLAKAQAPELYAVYTKWSNSFSEWYISTPKDRQAGTLERNYPAGNDWSSWTLQFNGYSGNINQKWTNQPDHWELRYANQIVTMRPVFRGDYTTWRIEGNHTTITWSKQFQHLDASWTIQQHPGFSIFTAFEGDPRDWAIEDAIDNEAINLSMKLAMAFISIYYSTPKQ